MPRFISSDGTSISYGDFGSGLPLVFVHGWLMSGAVWRYQLPMSSSYRVIIPDLRGHGDSDVSFFSYGACRDDLVELIDYLSLDSVILIGWSMGSQILLNSLSKLKGRVAAIILVSGTPCFCSVGDYQCGVSVAEARSMSTRLRRNYERTAGEFIKGMFAPGEISHSKLNEIVREIIGKLPSSVVALAALHDLVHADLRRELNNIKTPVLLLHGENDVICPSAASLFMLDLLGAARIKLFKESGHAPFLSRAEMFNGIVQDFAREVYGRN